MKFVHLKARAKINLAIDVLGKRDDGYHDLKMVMQTLNLYDSLHMVVTSKYPIRIVSNLTWLPTDERNLIYKAVKLLQDMYQLKQGVFINLYKFIPVSAGLGGGSSDCAAALIGMRKLFNLPISNSELLRLGATLGADVPYCLLRGTVLAEGIGERLTRLPPHPDVHVLLAKPSVSVSTASVFGEYDNSAVSIRPDFPKLIGAIEGSDINGISSCLFNVLESVTAKKLPVINDIKALMLDHNALGAVMSGTGPTVVGYFSSYGDMLAARHDIISKLNIRETRVTGIYNNKPNSKGRQ